MEKWTEADYAVMDDCFLALTIDDDFEALGMAAMIRSEYQMTSVKFCNTINKEAPITTIGAFYAGWRGI